MFRRFVAVLVAVTMSTIGLVFLPRPSSAAPLLSLTVPATATASYNFPLDVDGITLDDGGLGSVQVQLTVGHGTLSMTTTTGLIFVSGQGSGTADVQFTGAPAAVQDALDTLVYTPMNGYTGSDTLTYNTTPGGGLFNPDNGHFYEFIETGANITWTAAKAAAAQRTFAGMTGYLATVTTASEQAFVSSKLQGQGWLGASDDASQLNGSADHWVWAAGPEEGQEFWQGRFSGPTCVVAPCSAVSGRYNNWDGGEPNNAGGENFSHFLNDGEWNDYPNSASIQKYLVEYGGMQGDPVVVDTKTTALTVAVTAPASPASVGLTPGNGTIAVTWNAPANTGGAAIDNYLVEYSINGGTSWTALPTTTSTSANITGLPNGTSTQIRVSAHNSVGYGTPSTPVAATPVTNPGTPQSLAASVANGQSVVTWSAPTSNGGTAITGYRVEYSTDGTTFTTASSSTTSPFTLTPLTNGTAYTVRVTPINAVGDGTPVMTSVVPGTVPGVPSTPVLTSGNGQIGIAWSAPGSNGGHAILDYTVEYSTDGTTWTSISPSPTNTNATLTGLTNGTAVQVRVAARNDIGSSAPSTAVSATPLGPPGSPTGLGVATTPVAASVGWVAPAVTGGTPITGFTVEYRTVGGVWTTASTTATSPAELTGLTPGTGYEIRITANNVVGAGGQVTTTFTTNTPPTPGVSAPIHVGDDGSVTTVPTYTPPNPVQAIATTTTVDGSWTLTPDGGVFTAGDASFFGSLGNVALNAPAVGIAPTTTGDGYFIVAADGGVFAFGDAQFKGSMGGQPLNAPVTAIAPSCTKNGYYLVAADGGVFTFGDAGFHGSMGGKPLNQEMVGIVDSCGRNGYWTFARDGGVFTFGDANFYGSRGSNPPPGGIIAMVSAPDGLGYWLIGANRKSYGFGSVG